MDEFLAILKQNDYTYSTYQGTFLPLIDDLSIGTTHYEDKVTVGSWTGYYSN